MENIAAEQNGFIRSIILFALLILGGSMFYNRVVKAPDNFPSPTTFTIEKGETLTAIATNLKSEGLIRSSRVFKALMLLLGSDRKITNGDFYFEYPTSALGVAFRISGRNFRILQHKVVFPEGFTNKDMADRLKKQFPQFDSAQFLTLAKNKEGFLFPDTYSFSPNVTPEEVIKTLEDNFKQKTKKFSSDFTISERSQKEIIIMASIIEKEANGITDAKMISGILWKRIARGIPLQVDAPFYYSLGKTSSELTIKDLTTDSPYNTYTRKGLPPSPIGNPGLMAIEAALNPTESEYLYYLHDREGTAYYARTFDEHKINKQKYLD